MHEATQGTPTKQRTLRVHRPLRRRLWLWPLHLDSAPRPPDQRTPNPCTRRKTTSHTEESTRHSSPTVEPHSLLQQLYPPQHRQQRRADTVRTDEKEVDAEKSAAVETDSDEQEYHQKQKLAIPHGNTHLRTESHKHHKHETKRRGRQTNLTTRDETRLHPDLQKHHTAGSRG